MKRECIKYDLGNFYVEFREFRQKNIDIYIDLENCDDILDFLSKKNKKFRRILFQIFSSEYRDELYGHEEINGKTSNITAMKFSNSENIRIYCKEFSANGRKIVMIQKFYKKTQKVDNRLKNLLESLGGYEYDF